MDYQALLDRILTAVDRQAYLTPSAAVEPGQRRAMSLIGESIQSPGFEPVAVRALIERLYAEDRIDAVMRLSALHVVAAHPTVADYPEAARLAGEQELAAIQAGGPRLQDNLASVERHRGVLAFIVGDPVVALDYFSRAMERQRSAENLGNVLCCLIRLGEIDDAHNLLHQICEAYPPALVAELRGRVAADPDLALLRTKEDDK